MKFKYVSNVDWSGSKVRYLTTGKTYDFEMEGENYGVATDDNGGEVWEFFTDPSHGKWELVEE